MEKEKNIIIMVNYFSKANIQMEKKMEQVKNLIIMVNYYMKENIYMEKDGMENIKNIMIIII